MMKKTLYLVVIIVLLGILNSVPTFASKSIELYMDNKKVATESYSVDVSNQEGKYYTDVLPQVKKGRTYIPMSTITKLLGANISWNDATIHINHNNNEMILTIGRAEAIKNGNRMPLDAPPYIDKGRTMVPLRFISEALGLNVAYKDGIIHVTTPTLTINDTPIVAIQNEWRMTMGSVLSESKSNICVSRIYNIFNRSKSKEIMEPSHFGTHYDIDSPKFYYQVKEYTFKDDSNNIVAQYKIYSEQSFGMRTNHYVIEDVTNSKWYSFTEEKYYDILDLENLGEWQVISNTIV